MNFPRNAFVVFALLWAVNCQADSIGLANPALTTAASSGLKEIFAPLAGQTLSCKDPSKAKFYVCGRVLADGTPQLGNGYLSCTNWSNAVAVVDAWNDANSTYNAFMTTSGLQVEHIRCSFYGEYNCAAWENSTSCIVQWP